MALRLARRKKGHERRGGSAWVVEWAEEMGGGGGGTTRCISAGTRPDDKYESESPAKTSSSSALMLDSGEKERPSRGERTSSPTDEPRGARVSRVLSQCQPLG